MLFSCKKENQKTCRWELYLKSKSKITGFYQPTRRIVETYSGSTADTCSKLFVGKEVILRETTDSIITVIYNKEF